MGRGVRGLVKIDDTVFLEDVKGALGGRETTGQWGEMGGFNVQFLKVL